MSNLICVSSVSESPKTTLRLATARLGSMVRNTAPFLVALASLFLALAPDSALAYQDASPRVTAILPSRTVVIPGSVAPVVATASDQGRMDAAISTPHMTLRFAPSAEARTEIATLIHDQQDPGSANYHHWLATGEFESRFGLASSDLAKIAGWLRSAGFTVEQSTPMQIRFSGTVGQVETTFHTEMHQYTLGTRKFYSNSGNIALPASLSGVVAGVGHLNSLRPLPQHRTKAKVRFAPNFTDKTGDHFMVPADAETIYDVNPIYTAGYTGAGQTIVVVGQSAIDTADIDGFHTLFGGNSNLLLSLVPFTGDSAVASADDEEESDLDIEYSGSIATDAIVNFVYSGNDGSSDVFDAVQYAIQSNLAPIISISYGACELNLGSLDPNLFEFFFDQATAQGQTLVAAAGDAGATACDAGNNIATQGLTVQFPSDSPDVTGIGGTEFNEGSGTYWNSTNGAGYGSAISYIPEMAWNDSSSAGLAATGGGASTLFPKPDWQIATGVPNDGARDIPDVALDASNDHDSYFYCGPADAEGDSCATGYVYEAGGTSFGAPIFSGILTLINQSTASAGQGNINPFLYPLVVTTPAAFHDITIGNNDSPCLTGTTDCPPGTAEIGFSAGPGYDQTTGLGTIDALVLAKAFPNYGTGTSLAASKLALTYSPTAPNAGNTITFTATITSTKPGTPSGTVQFYVDGAGIGSSPVTAGVAQFASSPLTAGVHVVAAAYSGDSTFAATAGSLSLTVAALPVTSTILSIAPAAPTTATAITVTASVASGATGTLTGTVDFSIDGNDTSNPLSLADGKVIATFPALTAGEHTITAQYSGDSNFAASSGLIAFPVSAIAAGTVSVSVSPSAPSVADSVTATATLTAGATGTVQFLVDGTAVGTPVTASNSVATAALGALTAGSHTVSASYSGNAALSAASGSVSFVVSSSAAAFTLSATDATLAQNQSGDSTVTLTSTSDYAGTVNLSVSGSGPAGVCFLVNNNPTVSAHASANALIAIYSGTSCQKATTAVQVAGSHSPAHSQGPLLSLAFTGLAGVLFVGLKRRRKPWASLVSVLLLAALGMALGCGGSRSTPTTTAGTYTLMIQGTDSATASNTASTSFSLTIQ
jgi:subtilase family serine protease